MLEFFITVYILMGVGTTVAMYEAYDMEPYSEKVRMLGSLFFGAIWPCLLAYFFISAR